MKKFLCVLLILSMLFAISPTANAATYVNKASYIISGSSQYGRVATMALWTAPSVYINFSSTNQTYHTQGSKTTYHFEMSETVTYTASKSLTSNYTSAFTSLSNTLNVSTAASVSVGLADPIDILSTEPSGYYRFRAKFVCYKVVEEVVVSTSAGETVEWSNTITSAPSTKFNTVEYYKT